MMFIGHLSNAVIELIFMFWGAFQNLPTGPVPTQSTPVYIILKQMI